jgi:flagellar export protein FliJ
MTPGIRSRVDMRGFPWKLAMLERKLEHEVDQARAALAAVQCEADALAAAVQVLEEERAAQLQCLSAAAGQRFDPAAHAGFLRFLTQADGRLTERNLALARLRNRLAAARQDCIAADRALARVRKLRESAEAGYAIEQFRRQAKEADLAWLAGAARPRTLLALAREAAR